MRNASIAVLAGNRRGNRRIQRAVRGQSQGWPPDRDRDEPPRLALLGAGVKGNRFPHCQGRGQARGRLHARRDHERHHRRDPGVSFEPTIDYVVTKIPRFAFEKFKGAEPLLTTAMKSVGEVMAIGRNIHESLQKALRGLETGLSGFNFVDALVGASRDDDIVAAELATPDARTAARRGAGAARRAERGGDSRHCRLRSLVP